MYSRINTYPNKNVACVLHIYLLPCCTYAARVLHTQYTHIACVLHTQKLAHRHTHATYMHMRSHASEYMYATHVQLLRAAYMQFMYSIHAACKQLRTNRTHFFIYLYGMRANFCVCSMHAIWMYCVCSTRAAYIVTCVTCAGVQYVCCIHA